MNIDIRIAAAVAVVLTLLTVGCDVYEDPLPEDRDFMYYPIGVEMHPDGRFLYVVNSNFDLLYRPDQGGVATVIDTETGEILGDSSSFLPSFGAHIALDDDAETAYVASRESNEITQLEVAEDGQALYCDSGDGESPDTRPCTTGRVPDSRGGTRVPEDPFGVAVGEVERVDEESEELNSFDVVHLSHLVGQNVTTVSFPDGQIAGASMRSAGLVEEGGSQLEIRPDTEEVWVAGRRTNRIDAFSPFVNDRGEVEALVRAGSFRLTERDRSVDARGLAFDDDGDWMYVATRNPSVLHLVGMEASEDDRPQVVSSIPLERRPSEVQYHQGADGVDRLYVPSYRHGTIEVVEPDREAVVETIDVGRSPYVMTTDPSPVHCSDPGERCQGYVTLFDAGPDGDEQCDDDAEACGKVAVLDLDPASDSFHTVIETFE